MKDSSRRGNTGLSLGLIGSSVAVGAVILVGAAGLYLWYFQAEERDEIQGTLAAIAELQTRQVSQWREERLSDARFLEQSPNVARDVRALVRRPDDPEARAAVLAWLGPIKGGDRYSSVRVLDRGRRELVALSSAAEAACPSKDSAITETFRDGKARLVDLHADEGGQLHLATVVPIRAADSVPAEVDAVVVLRIDPRHFLFPQLQTWPLPSATGETLLVRRSGNDVEFLSPRRHAPDLSPGTRLPLTSGVIAAQALNARPGMHEGRDYRGARVVAAAKAIPDSPWVLVVKMDRSEAFAELRTHARILGLAAGATLAALLSLMAHWVRRRRRALVAEREEARRRAERLERRLAVVLREANEAILVFDRAGRVVEANPRAAETYGWPAAEFVGRQLTQLAGIGPEAAAAELARLASGAPIEVDHRARDGRALALEGSGRWVSIEGDEGLVVVLRDVSARRAEAADLARVNQLYSTLLRASAALVRGSDRESMGAAVCKAIVEGGSCRMAWIGWLDRTKRLLVGEAVAAPEGVCREVRAVEVDPQRVASGDPIAAALARREIVVLGEGSADWRSAPWLTAAHADGVRTLVVVPLQEPVDGRTGVLVLGAADPAFVSPAVLALLRQLAVDLALGLEVMAARRRVAESESRHRALFETSQAVLLLIDPADGRIVDANPAAERFYGWSRSQLQAMRITDINQLPAEEVRRRLAEADRAGLQELHFAHRRADGSIRQVVSYPSPLEIEGRRLIYSIVHDETERVEAVARLRESEERFRDLFESHPLPMWVYDASSLRFLAVNDMALQRYGYTREQFLALTLEDIRPAADRERLRRHVDEHREPAQQSGIWIHRDRAGREFRVEVTSHAVSFLGRPARLVLAQDVTEREQAHAALAESEARLKLALQAAQQGIYDLDVQTGVTKVSPEYAVMLGYDPETFVETNAAWIERLHPDDREKVAGNYRDYVSGRLPEYRVEFRQRTRDGRWKWILSLGRIVARDPDGRPRRMIGTHTDITERVAAETAQRSAESRLQFALERSNTGGWALDLDDQSAVRTLEHDRIFGYEALLPDWTYQRFLDHVLPEDRARVDAAFQDAVRRQGDWNFECRIRRRDGAVRWIWAAGGHEPFVPGGRRRMAGLVQDITERKNAVEELRMSERRFRALFDNNQYGMMLATPDGPVLEANPEACRLLGRTEEELRRLGPSEWLDPTDGRVRALLEERRRGGRTRGEVRVVRGDGSIFEADLASGLFETQEGPRASLVLRDVSERNRLLDRLRFQAARAETLLTLPAWAERCDEAGFLRRVAAETAQLTGGTDGFVRTVGADGALAPPSAFGSVGALSVAEESLLAADAVAGRRTVVRGGGTEGGSPTRPFVAVPVLLEGRVVMVAGVVGRPGGFSDEDVLTVRLIAELAWRIVHQRRAAAETEDALRHLNALFAASPVGLITYDHTGQARSANAAAAALLGGTVEQITALNFRRIPVWKTSGFLAAAEEALERREPHSIESRFTTSFGRDVWLSAQFVPFASGPHWQLLVLLEDIAARMQATAQLRLQGAALDAAANTIVITDTAGTIEWVNEAFCRSTGYSREEAVGKNPRVLKSGRHGPAFYAEMWETIRSGRVWHGEIRNRRKDGSDLDEDATITPVRGHDGGIAHFVAIKQDITERKRLEQQLLRSQRMEGIGLLAGGIAHDLNNILTPIQIGVDLLRKRATDARTLRTLEVLESSARRGAGIVRQVLMFARGVGGERVPLRLKDGVRELVAILEETFPRQIEIVREVPTDLPAVVADPSQLHQVLLNLAVNARDAMPGGGRLTFRAAEVEVGEGQAGFWGEARPGRYVRLTIADTGTGMPPEVVERIFDPFFTTKPQGSGTGLGLPTALGIVRSHGGFIAVDSRPGEGTEFQVHLPAVPDAGAEGVARSVRVDLVGAGQTILVCDDEPMLREIACSLLQQVGFAVVEATNGVEAVQRFQEHRDRIDGVLTDIMMPLMSGDRAVAEMLRTSPRLPIVFMSGLMEEAALLEVMETVPQVGGRLLKKPFTDQELFAALRAAGLGRPAPPQPPER